MKIQLAKLKSELKVLANEIRTLKSTRKQCANGYVSGLASAQQQFRIKHIARCLLRGRTIEQIEPTLRSPDSYENRYVRKQAAAIVASVVEAVNATPQP